ncbi:hypothetical protein SUGI_0819760 [Cryptomeria japonica]|nr:hypothetical protein SUGI_0819760 [Cryptomeria japonica]
MELGSVSVVISALCMVSFIAGSLEPANLFIIHMDNTEMPEVFRSPVDWYKSIISTVKGDEDDMPIYIYDSVMHGFSAMLTQSQLDVLEEMPGHLASFLSKEGIMLTTRSPEFLGLRPDKGLLPEALFGQDVIVGILDSGIWPETASFYDTNVGPVPRRWRGGCENTADFPSSLCNRKLIGARSYKQAVVAKYGSIDMENDYASPRDFHGHGTHVSSTAAGNYVKDVNFYGYASGTAHGVAPAARVAMYKVAWSNRPLQGADVLAAMEAAVKDGVDVLSLSISLADSAWNPFFRDAIAQGAFQAVKAGVLVVCATGNAGPARGILDNGAPWIFSIAASTIDRDYEAVVKLGDGSIIKAACFYTNEESSHYSISESALVYEKGEPSCHRSFHVKLKGAVLLCTSVSDSLIEDLKLLGVRALLLVLGTDSFSVYPNHTFPLVLLKPEDGAVLVRYASSFIRPVVQIEMGLTMQGVEAQPAPALARFSSRGPYLPSPHILKPDVTAPGVNILAASLPTIASGYAINSGTSMACPHVAGLAVLLKAVHRNWSPGAIRLPEIRLIVGKPIDGCPSGLQLGYDALNYPSLTAIFQRNVATSSSATFTRQLTNVGEHISSYVVVVEVQKGLKVQVVPDALQFKYKLEVLEFKVTVEVEEVMGDTFVLYGDFSWKDEKGHVVKSPVTALFL